MMKAIFSAAAMRANQVEKERGLDGTLICSFCGKSQKEVKKLIAGPTGYICDECIGLCNDLIAEAPKERPARTAQEKHYDEILASVVPKPVGHVEKPLPEEVTKHNGTRVYAVTTIASSEWYGGTRTPVVCDSFEAARRIVEENQGDIWECSYMLVVIEAVVCNWLYYNLDERYWYVWREDHYEAIECPSEYENIIGWGIG